MKTSEAGFAFITCILSFTFLINHVHSQDRSPAERELWNLEETYMTLLKNNDLHELSRFYHRDFIGWPSHSGHPVDRTEGRATLEALLARTTIVSCALKPRAIRILQDVAVTHYTVVWGVQDSTGVTSEISYRITHTWLRDEGRWSILGGMSSIEASR